MVITAGEEFLTDANGLEMVKRTRGARNTFAAVIGHSWQNSAGNGDSAEEAGGRPFGGGYSFPITAAIALRDLDNGNELSLVTDRGQGAACVQFTRLASLARSENGH